MGSVCSSGRWLAMAIWGLCHRYGKRASASLALGGGDVKD